MADEIRIDAERAGGKHGADRGGDDRHKTERCVSANDQLEAIEGAGQWRLKRRRDGARRAAADKRAHVAAAHPKHGAEKRTEARTDLRVAGFKPRPRGAKPAGDDSLQSDKATVDERHAAPMQRIGLDGIDRPAWPPAFEEDAGEPKHRAADCRHDDEIGRVQTRHPAEARVSRNVETNLMEQLDCIGGEGHQDRRHETRGDRQEYQRQFTAPDQTAPTSNDVSGAGFLTWCRSGKGHRHPRQSGMRKAASLRSDPAPTLLESIGHMTQTRRKDNRSAGENCAGFQECPALRRFPCDSRQNMFKRDPADHAPVDRQHAAGK